VPISNGHVLITSREPILTVCVREEEKGWVCVSRKTERKWVCDVNVMNGEMNLGMRLVCEMKNGGLWWLWKW